MVLSTLHTNDAPQTLTRLMNMGVPTFNIASSVLLITAQRLARRLCNCKTDGSPRQALLDAGYTESDSTAQDTVRARRLRTLQGNRLQGAGRHLSGHADFRGHATHDHERRLSLDLAAQAQQEGVKNLRESGLLKVKQGVTSLDEVLSTTNA